ncbi:MAG: hypothetical protein U0R50_13020 [Gaiellales bacterium]
MSYCPAVRLFLATVVLAVGLGGALYLGTAELETTTRPAGCDSSTDDDGYGGRYDGCVTVHQLYGWQQPVALALAILVTGSAVAILLPLRRSA